MANARTLDYQHIDMMEWSKSWERQGWYIVDEAWLEKVEQQLRNSKLWRLDGAENNETLGKAILWYGTVVTQYRGEGELP